MQQIFQQKNSLDSLIKFMTLNDVCRLSLANKFFRNLLNYEIIRRVSTFKANFITRLFKEVEQFQNNVQTQEPIKKNTKDQKQAKQSKQTLLSKKIKLVNKGESYSLFKTSTFELPKQFLANQTWVLVDQAPIADLDSLKGFNLTFRSLNENIYISINRSLIDPALFYKPEIIDLQETSKIDLVKLSQSNEFRLTEEASMQEILSRQKAILEKLNNQQEQTIKKKENLERPSLANIYNSELIAIILCHGGYFSVGVFDKNSKCIFHKSDHKYVKRGKQGQRQINKDSNAGSSIKSMGSQIRRDQEQKHQIKVSSILTEALPMLEKCDIVFLQAPGLNYQLLVNEQEPLFKIKSKLKSICITAKKANYTEVERIQSSINKIWLIVENENSQFI